MLSKVHAVRAPQALIMKLALVLMLASPFVASAQSSESRLQPLSHGQFESTQLIGENILLLDKAAPHAPLAFGAYRRFGFYISPVQSFTQAVAQLQVHFTSQIPQDAAILVDVRTSPDSAQWSLWQPVEQSGAFVDLSHGARFAQYRVALMANQESPQVSSLELIPQHFASGKFKAPAANALTFKVRATRQGMVGGRTANGHIITKRDRFVSLPCWCALSTKNGNEYKVRLSYNGRSTVVPVYDVGPWNRRDNYWDSQAQRYFSDLRQGWPQDHAAYYDGHNGGRSGLGWKVSFPTAVDVGDGAWWDDLKIVGDRAELEVTFLWTGNDTAAPAPTATAQPATATAQPAPPTNQPEVTATAAPSEPQVTPSADTTATVALPTVVPPEAPPVPEATAPPEAPVEQPTAISATTIPPTVAPATAVPPTTAPATAVPPTTAPLTAVPPTVVPATAVPPTAGPPTTAPVTAVPPTAAPATAVPPTTVPATAVPPTAVPVPLVEPPSATALPQKSASEPVAQVVDDRDPGFQGQAKVKWYDSPDGCGWNKHALWTYSAENEQSSENNARWSIKLPKAGMYNLQVYIPVCEGVKASTQAASYQVLTANGEKIVKLNQAKNAGTWVSLGVFSFSKNAAVELHDLTGEAQRVVWFDAVRWIPESK